MHSISDCSGEALNRFRQNASDVLNSRVKYFFSRHDATHEIALRLVKSLVHAMSDTESEAPRTCLKDVVSSSVAQYLQDMGNTPPDNLHERIMREVEVPLIVTVLNHTGGNQSRAAAILGMTRSTLRNRIRRYGL